MHMVARYHGIPAYNRKGAGNRAQATCNESEPAHALSPSSLLSKGGLTDHSAGVSQHQNSLAYCKTDCAHHRTEQHVHMHAPQYRTTKSKL